VREITRTATFAPGDPLARILDDFACPSCGHRDTGDRFPSITGGRARMFCDSCGAFVTIMLSDEQAGSIGRPDIVRRYRA
jgi:hypothetical protein